MVKVLDCDVIVCEFELQTRYNVHFRTDTLEKVLNSVILKAMRVDCTFTVQQSWLLALNKPTKVWHFYMALKKKETKTPIQNFKYNSALSAWL